MNEVEKYKKLVEELRKELREINDRQALTVQNRKDTLDKKLADGVVLTANGPSWLQLNNGIWELIGKKVLIIEQIFAMAARGLSAGVIAEYLRETQVERQVSADEWTDSSVNAVIKNVAVLGHMQGKKKDAPPLALNYYPPIIQQEVFELIQKHIKNRTGGHGSDIRAVLNLFTGLMKCNCGSVVRYMAGGKKSAPYLQCRNATENKGCTAERLPYQPVEDQLMTWICEEHQFDMSVNRPVSKDASRSLKLDLMAKESALQLMKANKENGATVSKEFDQKFVDLAEEILILRTKIANLPMRFLKTGSEETRQLWDRHNAATGKLKIVYRLRLQAAIKIIVSEIHVAMNSKHTDDGSLRTLKLFGPVFGLLYADRTEVEDVDQREASRKFSNQGVKFVVKLPLKA